MSAWGIVGTGSYLPEREISNKEVAEWCGVSAEWIEERTEILTRRYAAPDEATSDLAATAATRALRAAGITADQLDHVIVSTSTGDSPQPPTAYLVQDAIGAHAAACFDINVVCSGFVYGLEVARRLLAANPRGHALVIGADVYSRILDYGDHRTAVLLGDGAGAAVLGPVPDGYGFLGTELVSDGAAHHLIRVEAGGSRMPTTAQSVAEGRHYFRMDGRGVRDFVMDNVPPILHRLLQRAGIEAHDVDHLVPHQPNGVLLRRLVERCAMTRAHTHRTLERYGNIGSASVPVALDDACRSGRIHGGDLTLLAGFGGGMSVGATLMRWQEPS
ncbi:3-oxoacyl-ACP synthase III family protein [Streptomyces sp. NPDC056500]|uniref:3-oxoacyl-ACP synthase III family protein n=1 Tax=Streptomyces sp. NPDC056500 TaxID=3345840 RepID=UPI0036AC9276